MRRASSLLVLCVLLGFGVSLAVQVEDVPETAYDESEGPPYESTPLFPIVPLAAARTLQSSLSSFHLKVGVPSPVTPARVRHDNAHRSSDARVSLASLCTLLC
jgi:hypothetical protein